MNLMKATLPRPEHESYLKHRKQVIAQIIAPVMAAAFLLILAAIFIGLAAFGPGGDVARWGAVAAIWIVAPLLLVVLVLFALLAGLAYLMGRLLGILPVYTGKLQDLVYRIESVIKRFSNMTVKPVFGLSEIGATLKALVGRK